MNTGLWGRLVFLSGLLVLLTACSPTAFLRATSPTPVPAEVFGPILSYRATYHQEVQHPQPNGSTTADVVEYNYEWVATDGPFGYDAHAVTTLAVPQSPTPGVMDEVYASGDFVYQLAWNGWGATARASEIDDRAGVLVLPGGTLPDSNVLARLSGLPLPVLLAASTPLGDELTGGLRATHYQLTDESSLAGLVRARLAIPPPPTASLLTIDSVQLDIWLGATDGLPVQLILSATGKTEASAGSGVSVPFVIADRYAIGAINSGLSVVVPAEILNAVKDRR